MIDYLDRIYTKIENSSRLLTKYRYYSMQRLFIRLLSNIVIPAGYRMSCKKTHPNSAGIEKDEKRIIVSLTSFPQRINRLWIVIESLLRQTHHPDKIILWLSKDQFASKNILPRRLLAQESRGLEIKIVNGDIKSHKKYFYTLREYPDDILVTVDDDIYYPTFIIEKLIEYSGRYPKSIICHRAMEIAFGNDKIHSYKHWNLIKNVTIPCSKLFYTSGGGTLFPPHSLHEDVLNEEAFTQHCFFADDVWLNCMSQLIGTLVVKTDYYSTYLPVFNFNNESLSKINVNQMGNDFQLEQVRKYCIEKHSLDPFEKILKGNETC